jgi:hypothetical protein
MPHIYLSFISLRECQSAILCLLINCCHVIQNSRQGPPAVLQTSFAYDDKALNSSGLPSKLVIDNSGANIASLDTLNVQLWLSGYMLCMIEVLTVKYLNNIVE